ncbi:hypothetical protein ABPG75_012881 [Micractinium tetrahymenae]
MAERPEKQGGRTPGRPLISLQDVTESSTAELISRIAGDALAAAGGGGGGRAAKKGQAAASVAQLLERFERADKELGRLQQQVDLRAERLRREVGAEQASYLAKVAALEAEWAGVRRSFGELESKLTGVTQAATKIGNRLQNADLYRRWALEAAEQITCLQEFAHARDPSDLSPLFHDDSRLAEAAAMTGKLLAVAQELISARERVGLAEPRPQPSTVPQPGSLEAAVEQLELYRNVLDNRVVSRFDAALARQDLPAMADCARIMAEFSRGEAILVQRYISTRPMFTNLRELAFAQQQQQQQQEAAAAAAGGGSEAEALEAEAATDLAALRGLSSLYKSILSTLRDEAVVIEQVFPSPSRALGQYIQRVFEQKVQTAVDAALRPPPPNAGHAMLRGRLRQLAEVYRKTRGLADDLQELCGGGSEGAAAAGGTAVRDLADMVCADALEAYLPMELRWLGGLYEQKAAAARAAPGGAALSMEAVLDMLAMNEEAASRCVLLSPPAQLAANMRQLFHASTRKQANTGCLLEQVATHLVLGLGQAVEACSRALLGPFRPQQVLEQEAAAAAVGSQQQQGQVGSPPGSARAAQSRAALQRAAQLAMAGSIGRVLQAVSTIGAIASVVQQHYQRVLAPHLGPPGGAEARACSAGLAALVKAVDERVVGALQRCLSLLASQADMTLVAEQRRDDFCPGEAAPPPSLDEPTPACVAACALLGAAVDAAGQHLHGPNLSSFLAELGRRACLVLDAHMQRFSFSPLGALRWKRDLADYAALVARLRSAAAAAHLEDMQAKVNLLIVAPDSLRGLVDGTLRIPHRAALAVISLRQDFRSARVGGEGGGATLAALFSSE